MSWGTRFNCNIEFIREHYKTIEEVESAIDEYETDNVNIRTKINMFVSSTPKDIVSEEWKDQPVDFLYNNVNDLLAELESNIIKINNLILLKENFETKEEW